MNVRLELNEGSSVHVHTDMGDVDVDIPRSDEVVIPRSVEAVMQSSEVHIPFNEEKVCGYSYWECGFRTFRNVTRTRRT